MGGVSGDRPGDRRSAPAEGAEEPPALRVRVRHPEWPHDEEIITAESHEALGHWDAGAWHPVS